MPETAYDYKWVHSEAEAIRLQSEGWEFAGESGRYPTVLLRRKSGHCGACGNETRLVFNDLGRYTDICQEGKCSQ